MQKIYFKIIVCIISALCLAMFFACGDLEQPDETNKNSQRISVVQEMQLGLFESIELHYEYDGEESVVLSSSDASVVGIDGTVLTAHKTGFAVVTLTAGEGENAVKAQCNIAVNSLDVSELSVNGSFDEIYVGDLRDISIGFYYKNKPVSAENLQLSVSGSAVLENGKLRCVSAGTATVSVAANIGGNDVNYDVYVLCSELSKVEICDTSVSLDVGESKTVTVKTYEKGVEVLPSNVIYSSSDDAVFSVDENGKVTAVGSGIATLTVRYSGQKEVEDSILITVNKLIKEYDGTVEILAREGYVFDSNSLFGDVPSDIEDAYLDYNGMSVALNVNDYVISFENINVFGNLAMVVETQNVKYKINIILWTEYIATAEQLKMVKTTPSGYFKLIDDVDLSDTEWSYSETETGGFSGYLNGNGNSIKGLNIEGSYGLFKQLDSGALIENLALDGFVIESGATRAGSIAGIVNGEVNLKNCVVVGRIYGTYCGGVFGSVSSNADLSIQNIGGYVYSSDTNGTNGAIFGTANNLTFISWNIYSSLKACGNATENNSKRDEINSLKGIKSPEITSAEIYLFNDGYDFDLSDLSGVEHAAVVNQNFRKETVDAYKRITVYKNDVFATGYQGDIEIVAFNDEGKVINAYVFNLLPIFHIYQSNIEDIKYITDGEVYLKSDIDMSGISWGNYGAEDYKTKVFSGVFDGEGHTISNFNTGTSTYRGALFAKITGTVKNLIIKDAVLHGSNAVLAGRVGTKNTASAVFENLIISASCYAVHTNVNHEQAVITSVNEGMILKNVLIKLADNLVPTTFGFAAGGPYCENIILENAYFIGGRKTDGSVAPIGCAQGAASSRIFKADGNTAAQANVDYFAFESLLDFENAVSAGSVMLNTFLADNYEQISNYVRITKNNISEKLHNATNEYFILTEDIDMSELTWASYGATDYNDSSKWFTGVFDGNGHTISNFTTNGSNFNGGLFCCIAGGTVKNLIIKDANITNSNGIIASRTRQNSTVKIENVFITVKTCGTTNCGAIIGASDATLNLINVFISMPDSASESVHFINGVYRRTINIDGLYCVGNVSVYTASGANNESVTGEAKTYSLLADFAESMQSDGVNEFIINAYETVFGK